MASSYNLLSLSSKSALSINTTNTRSKIIDIEVPQQKFFVLIPGKPIIFRPGAVEFQTYTVPATVPTEFDLTALADAPAKPPDNFIPTWPSIDGYTFKVYINLNGTPSGPWTRATINAVNWSTKVLTIALPSTLVDGTGATHTIASGDVINIRVSYAFTSGNLEFTRELPDNAVQRLARTFYTANPGGLNQVDQYGYAKITLPTTVWLTDFCHLRAYLNAPVYFDIGQKDSVTDTTYDLSMVTTKIELPVRLETMEAVQAAYSSRQQIPGVPVKYPTLYGRLVAELAGIEPPITLPL